MNNTLRVFRKLLTFRSCNRIINSSYCDGHNVNNKWDGKVSASVDGSSSEESHSQLKDSKAYKASTSTTKEAQSSSLETAKELTNKNITHNVGESGTERLQSKMSTSVEVDDSASSETDDREAMNSQLNEKDGGDSVSTHKSSEYGFLEAFNQQEKLVRKKSEKSEKKPGGRKPISNETFASLLRNSTFIDMGDPVGKTVVGEIFLVVEEDLYIDFGWKFHTVCPMPKKNSQFYVPGAKVFLKIKDLELSTKFLGEKSHISLLEADCDLIGLAFSKDRMESSGKAK